MISHIKLDTPAEKWEDGLPLGNSRIGAMIMGQLEDEIIPLNEETIYYGGPKERHNPDALKNLGKIRELLISGETRRAEFLAKIAFTSMPKYLSPFIPAGNLRISYSDHKGKVSNYLRNLDIDNAIATVTYTIDSVDYKREYLTSLANQVFAVRITGGKPITLMANLNRRPYEQHSSKLDETTVGLWGRCGEDGVRYFLASRIVAEGGKAKVSGDFLTAECADSIIIYTAIGTDFDTNIDYREDCISRLDVARKIGYEAVKAEHIELFHSLYRRVKFSVNNVKTPKLCTDRLLQALGDGGNFDYLCVLLFNFGRYLLISSSYNCRIPANLQGIWNGSYTPPWESAFTININTQMNYWPAEVCNLSECHTPLLTMVERMVESGKRTAKALYGCRGFVAHHNTDIWADTAPTGILASSPIWPMGGAWLALHLYEHYLFTMDENFLREHALPVMEQAVIFFEDYLYEDEDGMLLTGPSLSPENTYISKVGQPGALCMAPTMDCQILHELFADYLDALEKTGGNPTRIEQIQDILVRIPQTRITSDGRIMEWQREYEELELGHRHISHLFGLYPGSQITEETPNLFTAAVKTLESRLSHGGGHTGWSRSWIVNFQARLKNGNEALSHIKAFLANSTQDNMLGTHPPFQIDGNFGITAGIAEMLVQSHGSNVMLLPALPREWRQGNITGLRVRGNVTIDLFWNNNELSEVVLIAGQDTVLSLSYADQYLNVRLAEGVPKQVKANQFYRPNS